MWEPADCSVRARITVRDDIANYARYEVLGSVPDVKRARLVQRIYEEASHAGHPWAERARHRGEWASEWLMACGMWGSNWSI